MDVKKLTSLIIEPTNLCNLSCSICPTNNGMKREKGYMPFDLFKKAIDGTEHLEHLCLHNWGEPILNKELFKMIDYAHKRKVQYTVFNTNGSLLNNSVVQQILDSSLSILRFSVDGTPETFRQIRGIDFSKIETSILNLIRERDECKSSLVIDIVMVINEETEKQIDSFYDKWNNVVDNIRFQPKLTSSKRMDFCPELFGKNYGELVVLWDGSVVPCCVDYEGTMLVGNVNLETVDSIWNGKAVSNLRERHLQKDFPEHCLYCNEYESRTVLKRFVVDK